MSSWDADDWDETLRSIAETKPPPMTKEHKRRLAEMYAEEATEARSARGLARSILSFRDQLSVAMTSSQIAAGLSREGVDVSYQRVTWVLHSRGCGRWKGIWEPPIWRTHPNFEHDDQRMERMKEMHGDDWAPPRRR